MPEIITRRLSSDGTKWTAFGRPDIAGSVPVEVGMTRGPLPDLPTVTWESLYRTGDVDMRATLARLSTYSQVTLPNGFDEEFADFSMASGVIGIFYPNLRGFYGPGKDLARIRIKRGSSTQMAKVPAQSTVQSNQLTLMRTGRFEEPLRQHVMQGFELQGTDQPIAPNANPNEPHMYNGMMNYGGVDSFYQDLRISGIPGDYNFPPGETFALNNYKDLRTTIRDVEVTGFNLDGRRVGGSSSGGNNSVDQYLEDCYFHDSRVSSLTWSYTGTHTNINAISRDVTTRRVWVKHNANHRLAAGQRMTCFNHENVGGKIRHYQPRCDLTPLALTEWNASHMTFQAYLFDNQDIEIHDPIWSGSPVANNGCFTVGIQDIYGGTANAQKTPPKVFRNGKQLIPYQLDTYSSKTLPVGPDTHFVVVHD